MNVKRKVTVTTGTRSEYGILRPLLKEISKSGKLELYLIVAGMHLSKNHGMTINEIKKDGFKIHAQVDMLPKGNSTYFMSISLGKGIMKFSNIFKSLKPDINLILGDRDEALASALAACHMNIPNAHIHGGDRSKAGIDEYNRHAITKISNIHFAVSKLSKKRIIRMGENPKFVFLTGSPSVDEIKNNQITDKKTLENTYDFKFNGSDILLLYHPVTTETNESSKQISNILSIIKKIHSNTISILPNSDAGHEEIFRQIKKFAQKYDFIKVYPTLPRKDFLGMLQNCGVLIGNSSSGMIEASYFRIPVINVGIRQKDRERGSNVIDVKNSEKEIYRVLLKILTKIDAKKMKINPIYGNGDASKKIVRILERIKLDKNLIQKQIYY